jgi:hypothetical protein
MTITRKTLMARNAELEARFAAQNPESRKTLRAKVKAALEARRLMQDAIKKADAFTLTVERFTRSDLPDGMEPVTEAEVAEAMYSLRGTIANLSQATA